MAFNCRIFAHRGLAQMIKMHPTQFSSDSVYQLSQPYEWGQNISVSAVAVSSAPQADVNSGSAVNILRVEVPDGEAVRYEINQTSINPRTAGANSPMLTGRDQFEFKSGWTISLIDAAGLP